jgi:hypothetical protein
MLRWLKANCLHQARLGKGVVEFLDMDVLLALDSYTSLLGVKALVLAFM